MGIIYNSFVQEYWLEQDAKRKAEGPEMEAPDALFAAAKGGDLAQLRLVLKEKPQVVDVPARAARGMSALAVVCMQGNVEAGTWQSSHPEC